MPCINAPTLPIPTLGGGLSIDITLPTETFDLALCCKILAFDLKPPPIAFGVIPPGVVAILAAQIKFVQAYIDTLPPKCPKE